MDSNPTKALITNTQAQIAIKKVTIANLNELTVIQYIRDIIGADYVNLSTRF